MITENNAFRTQGLGTPDGGGYALAILSFALAFGACVAKGPRSPVLGKSPGNSQASTLSSLQLFWGECYPFMVSKAKKILSGARRSKKNN